MTDIARVFNEPMPSPEEYYSRKERARIMAIIEAKKKMYSESNGLVYVLDIILKEIESKK